MSRTLPSLIVLLSSLILPGPAVGQAPAPDPSTPRVGGYIQARERIEEHVGLTATLNRARVTVEGPLPSRFSYRLMAEYEAGGAARTAATVSLRDAYIRWSRAPVTLWFGQFKTPFSREYITSIAVIETADRSTVVDTLAPKRDIGLMGEVALGTWATAAFGVFNGEGQNIPANRDSTVMLVGRVTGRPLAQITVAGDWAWDGPDSSRYGAEIHVEHAGALVRSEYIERRRSGGRESYGWYVLAGYRVLPWAQLIARQEDFHRPSVGPARRISATTLGANLDLGARTRLVLDVVSRTTGAQRKRSDALIAQLQVRY